MKNKHMTSSALAQWLCCCLMVVVGAIWITGSSCNVPMTPSDGGGGGTPRPTATPTPSPSASATPTPTASASPTPSPSPTVGPTQSPSPTPTPSTPPMSCAQDSDCDDGLFCNGEERCAFTSCTGGDAPCNSQFETCDEDSDTCGPTQSGCLSDDDCDPGERCDVNSGQCIDVGANVCGPGAGNCYVQNFSPGCEDPSCCEIVCAFDNSCCFFSWTQSCADQALSLCPSP